MGFPTTNHKVTLLFISLLLFAIAVEYYILFPDLHRISLVFVLGLLLVCATPIAYRHRRRWLRFSLRTMLIVVTVLSVPLGWVGWRLREVQRERATIAWIEKMGGSVSIGPVSFIKNRSWWEESTDKWFGNRVSKASLRRMQASDLSLLANLKYLRTLDLYAARDLRRTQLGDLSPLANLKYLQTLDLSYRQVSDLSPLAELKNLELLKLKYTQVSDLSPLAGLKNLERLWLDNTQVSDLSPLAELKNLETLKLYNTQVCDLSPLAELKNLKRLYLHDTLVSDVSPLAELKRIKRLYLHDTQVSYEQVQELRQALPNCRIEK